MVNGRLQIIWRTIHTISTEMVFTIHFSPSTIH